MTLRAGMTPEKFKAFVYPTAAALVAVGLVAYGVVKSESEWILAGLAVLVPGPIGKGAK